MEIVQTDKIEIYNEAGFQHELGCYLKNELSKIEPKWSVQFERNISSFGIGGRLKKTEIDLVIVNHTQNSKKAIELKIPLSGQVPIQMYKSCEDVKFLEQLLKNGFDEGVFILITTDRKFWQGRGINTTYQKYRVEKKLYGTIECTTGKDKGKKVELVGLYQIDWKTLIGDYRYFMIHLMS